MVTRMATSVKASAFFISKEESAKTIKIFDI